MDSTAVTVIVSAVLTVMAQIYREGRQRRWDQEDRARLAGELATKVEAQRAFLSENLAKDRQQRTDNHDRSMDAIRGAAAAGDAAFKEANHVNNKISDLNARLLAQQETEQKRQDAEKAREDLAPQILATSEDTNAIVTDIQHTVHRKP